MIELIVEHYYKRTYNLGDKIIFKVVQLYTNSAHVFVYRNSNYKNACSYYDDIQYNYPNARTVEVPVSNVLAMKL